AIVVSWLTWPLGAHIRSHLPKTGAASGFDALYSVWALAWESHTLARGSLDIADANIYYPARDALFYGPAGNGSVAVLRSHVSVDGQYDPGGQPSLSLLATTF